MTSDLAWLWSLILSGKFNIRQTKTQTSIFNIFGSNNAGGGVASKASLTAFKLSRRHEHKLDKNTHGLSTSTRESVILAIIMNTIHKESSLNKDDSSNNRSRERARERGAVQTSGSGGSGSVKPDAISDFRVSGVSRTALIKKKKKKSIQI